LCTGEWTRNLTGCECCPQFLYKRNIVKETARLFGLTTKTIEIKNITAGDLPYDSMRGDFYVAVSVSSNPDMVTSLQEEKLPKLVHFPEILQLKVHDNALASRVVFQVRELNTFGHDVLCELVLSPSAIIDFANDPDPLKRFQMKSKNDDIERETPAWIAMEFSHPTETRKLDQIHNAGMTYPEIRTFLPPRDAQGTQRAEHAHAEVHQSIPAGTHKGQEKKFHPMESDGSILNTRALFTEKVPDFKGRYMLLDDSGNPVEEPDEHNLWKIQSMRSCCLCAYRACNCWSFLLIIAYLLYRWYLWSCFRQFRWITMWINNGRTMPAPYEQLRDLEKECHKAVTGTGEPTGTPCRPNNTEVLTVCEELTGSLEANRPEAFTALIYDTLNVKTKGISCYHGCCRHRNEIVDTSLGAWLWVAIVVLLILTRVCHCCATQYIKNKKKSFQRDKTTHMTKYSGNMALRSDTHGGGVNMHNVGSPQGYANAR
jgi:hypothetical protein